MEIKLKDYKQCIAWRAKAGCAEMRYDFCTERQRSFCIKCQDIDDNITRKIIENE